MTDYPKLHLDTNQSKGTACSKKEHGCNYPKLHLDAN